MRGFRKTLLAALAGLALTFGAGVASADAVYTITGNLGGFAGPYVTVDVNLTTPTTATVTFTSLAHDGNTFLIGDGSAADVNVNATSWTIGSFSNLQLPGFQAASFANAGSKNVGSGIGVINQTTDGGNGYSDASYQASFVLTNTSGGTWASAGNVLTNNSNGFPVAAHIFVCSGGSSGNVLTNPCTVANGALFTGFATVPIPAAAWLFGSGLLGLIAIARRRIKGGNSPALA